MPAPNILPPELAAFFSQHEFALVSTDTDQGAVLAAKMPKDDIERCRGPVPFLIRYELHQTIHGPVVRMLMVAQTPPEHLYLETFCNVGDTQQLTEWRDLMSRPLLRVLFYDETLQCRLSKGIRAPWDPATRDILTQALRILVRTAPALDDFDRAKAQVMAENPI